MIEDWWSSFVADLVAWGVMSLIVVGAVLLVLSLVWAHGYGRGREAQARWFVGSAVDQAAVDAQAETVPLPRQRGAVE